MPIFAPADSTDFTTHGSTFAAYVNPSRGSAELCAWKLTVPPDLAGVAHRPSREEVLLTDPTVEAARPITEPSRDAAELRVRRVAP